MELLTEHLVAAGQTPAPGANAADSQRRGLEQMIWAFVAGSEFRFNH